MQRPRIDRHPGVDQAALAGVGIEHLAGERPELHQSGGQAGVAHAGAIAQTNDPFGGVAQMIRELLFRLGCDRGQRRVCRAHHGTPERIGAGSIQELSQDGHCEIAVRLLQQKQVLVVAFDPAIGEIVLVMAAALYRAGIGVERLRLADQVEPHIGQRHVLLHGRRMAAPFGQAMPQDQSVVGAAQRVADQRRGRHLYRCRHRRRLVTCGRFHRGSHKRSGGGRSSIRRARTAWPCRAGRMR